MRKNNQYNIKGKVKHSLHADLLQWGNFTQLEEGGMLGYSSSHLLKELSKFGVRVSSERSAIQWPSRAAEIDEFVGKLIKTRPKWGIAVKLYYTTDVEKNKIRTLARLNGLKKSTYHEHLQKERNWISDRLKSLH